MNQVLQYKGNIILPHWHSDKNYIWRAGFKQSRDSMIYIIWVSYLCVKFILNSLAGYLGTSQGLIHSILATKLTPIKIPD